MSKLIFRRGDIWMVEIDRLTRVNTALQYGKRPCVILSNDKGNFFSSVLSVIPLTTKRGGKDYPTHVFIEKSIENQMLYDSTALCEQSLTIEKTQALFRIGQLEEKYIEEIEKAFMITMGLHRFIPEEEEN